MKFRPLLAALGCALLVAASAMGEQTVINAGKGGHNTRNLLKRLEEDALSHKPDLVILGAGTNDAINSSNSVPMDEFIRNFRSLIRQIRAGGVAVIVITPPPCLDEYVLERHPAAFFKGAKPSAKVWDYSEALVKLCREEKAPVVDLYTFFRERGNLGDGRESWLQNPANSRKRDGVHPTAAGYAAIAVKIREAIAGMEITPERIVCLGDSITYGAGARSASSDLSYPARLQTLLAPPQDARQRE